jgi:glycosyltransferase involved in cell wall biosynthesis
MVSMEHDSADDTGPATNVLRVPVALGLTPSGRHFSTAGMRRKVKVLFMIEQPTVTPAISVHLELMRWYDPERVEVHAAYNRLAASEPYASSGSSVLDVVPATTEGRLHPVDFGPSSAGSRWDLLAGSARAVIPAVRDTASLRTYIQRHHIDIIHCEEGTRNAFYSLALSRMTRAKCVVHFHAKYGDWMSPLSRFAVQRADAVVAVSHWTGQVMAQGGVSPGRIFPVLNGIDVDRWNPSTVDGGPIRHEFGLEPRDPLVVMVAQLTAWKRQTTLIEAFRMVVQSYPNARALLVGRDWDTGAGYTDSLRGLIAEAGLGRHVHLVGQRRDVPQILAAADIVTLPSVDDPCPLAHIEAMAMATPIVTVQTGGAPELVEDGKSGLVGPVDDSAQLATNIVALIDDPSLRREMGAHARQHVLEYLNVRRMASDVEAVYRRVLGCEHSMSPEKA